MNQRENYREDDQKPAHLGRVLFFLWRFARKKHSANSEKNKRSVGATLKYADLIAQLEDDKLYTPATISRLVPEIKRAFECQNRITKSLGWFSRYHGMSEEPDGFIKQYKAWFGRTWKAHVKPEDFEARKVVFDLKERRDRRPLTIFARWADTRPTFGNGRGKRQSVFTREAPLVQESTHPAPADDGVLPSNWILVTVWSGSHAKAKAGKRGQVG